MTDTLTPAKDRIDAARAEEKRFREMLIVTERSRLPVYSVIDPVPAEENEKDYSMGSPISKAFEGVCLTVLGVIMAAGVGLFGVLIFLWACFVLLLRVIITLSKKLLPVAILIVLGLIAYKLWQL